MPIRMPKILLPTLSFPYRITFRLAVMALPRKQAAAPVMPARTECGVRRSALRGRITERVNEAALPYVRRLLYIRQLYKDTFNRRRLKRLDKLIAKANASMYSKYSNSVVSPRRLGGGDLKVPLRRSKAWNETDWRKHMDYIDNISKPKPEYIPEPVDRGPSRPLSEMMARIKEISQPSPNKIHTAVEDDIWYKDPYRISPAAMRYQASERIKKLAVRQVRQTEN